MKQSRTDDIYTRITNHIVEAIEKGAGDWKMPWHVTSADTLAPKNIGSNRQYRGVNVLSLWTTAEARGYTEGLWGTYRQWQAVGGQVKSAEKATPVVFWKIDEKEVMKDDRTEAKKTVLGRGYSVFNIAQVGNYKPPEVPKLSDASRLESAERFFHGVGADIRHDGDMAFYDPKDDYVQMPDFDLFYSAIGYYSTLAHELTHWTGNSNRLSRDFGTRFGDKARAMEELVAELGSAFQMGRLGCTVEPRHNHASYVASWLTLLRNDKRAVFTAAAKAQEATDWLQMKHEQMLEWKQTPHAQEKNQEHEITRDR